MKKYVLAALCCLLVTAGACKKESASTPGEAENGYATGNVVDTKGKPLANVSVTIENTLTGTYNSYVGKTDANGNYKIKVGQVGTYHASAYLAKEFNGINYSLPLHSDNDAVFSNAGAVRNFKWKLTGDIYGGGHYGSNIDIVGDWDITIEDQENIEYTLTPVGKLIDGSDGSVLKLHTGLPQTEGYNKLLDIPIGRYTMTAAYVKNGTRKPLRLKIRDTEDAYAASITINFPRFWYEGVWVMYNW